MVIDNGSLSDTPRGKKNLTFLMRQVGKKKTLPTLPKSLSSKKSDFWQKSDF
jgi:hypothetical protein